MRSARRATSVAAEATNVSSAQTSFHRTAAGPACDGELITLLLERAFNGHSGIATEIPILFAAASEIRKQRNRAFMWTSPAMAGLGAAGGGQDSTAYGFRTRVGLARLLEGPTQITTTLTLAQRWHCIHGESKTALKPMGSIPERITLLAVVIPALQSHLSSGAWIVLAIVCLCAWGLVAGELRGPRKPKPPIQSHPSSSPTVAAVDATRVAAARDDVNGAAFSERVDRAGG